MQSEWKKVKIGDVCKINANSYSSKDNWEFVNYLDTGNITENKIDSIQNINLKIDKLPSRAKRKVKFKNWFIDFAPFGGTMPSDWKELSLADIADFINGYSYTSSELKESKLAMATIKNFDRNGGFKIDGYKELIPTKKIKTDQYIKLFDIIVAHTDLTQKAEIAGNAEIVLSKSKYEDIICSMDIVKVKPKCNISNFLIMQFLKDSNFKTHCLKYVNGTTVLHLSKKALPKYKICLPSDLSILSPVVNLFSEYYNSIANNTLENERLAELRDTLLPRVMSGELDVSNVELKI